MKNLLARLTIKNNKNFISVIAGFVKEIALKEGLNIEDARRLELVTDEACMNVIDHAFEKDEEAYFDVLIERRPGQIVIAIEDKGLPFDWKSHGQRIGLTIMKTYSDEINFMNLGKEGKRLELIKNLPYEQATFEKEETKSGEITPVIQIRLRFLDSDEGLALSKCFYHVYGYNYDDYVYYPEKIKELIDLGLQKSAVAIDIKGDIVGHMAVKMQDVNSVVAEICQIALVKKYHDMELLNEMAELCINYAREKEMYGLYSEVPLYDQIFQEFNLSIGGSETGFSIMRPPVENKNNDTGRTSVLFYLKINDGPERSIYPPLHHTTIIRKIYEHGKIKRKFEKLTRKAMMELSHHSQVDIKIVTEHSNAFIRIMEYGADLKELVKVHLKELCLNKISCIYLDLPLSLPATSALCSSFEYLGFFFAGIIPELRNGDILRLQYLNNVDITSDRNSIVSDFASELFNYILKCQGECGIINLV